MNGKKPTKEEAIWLDKITQLGCIVCLIHHDCWSPAQVHHIYGGDNHFFTIPLCHLHHQGSENNEEYVSRHPFKREFEKRYGTEIELLGETKRRVNHDKV